MSQKPRGAPERDEVTFGGACALLDAVLRGGLRRRIVNEVSQASHFGQALERLRAMMRAHVLQAGPDRISLAAAVSACDRRTRQDGFHALNDWDGKADTVNADTIPVDVLNYLIDQRGDEPADAGALAILLDYHFLYVLALLSVRIWDEGDADDNLARLNELLGHLQGPEGGGQAFVDNAETLLLLATSHFELEERGYDTLLERTRTLNDVHRLNIALGHAAAIGSHLRFGFEATYARDTLVMRNDNVADYPWLGFALATLMREYARLRETGIAAEGREAIVEAILNGLSSDARAFIGDHAPAPLSACEADRTDFRERFQAYRADLLDEFERHRPTDAAYSPLSFYFNFSYNIVKGTVVDAVHWGDGWPLTLNDLLTSLPRGGEKAEAKRKLATTLMGYARSSPDRIRGRLMPVVVYDPDAGRRSFATTLRRLKD